MTKGRKPERLTKKEAKRLVDASWSDNGSYRNYVGRLRRAYRTGKWAGTHEDDRANYELRQSEEELLADITDHANFIRPLIDPLAASQSSRVPDFVFDPADKTPEGMDIANTQTALTRGAMERDEVGIPLRAMALDRRISGHGFGHIGWRRVERPLTDSEKDKQWDTAYADFLSRLQAYDDERREQLEMQGRPTFEFVPSSATSADLEELEKSLPTTKVVENRPTLTRISPGDVLLPTDVSDSRNLPWYAIVRYQRLSELREDETLDQNAVERLGTTTLGEEFSSKVNRSSTADDVDPLIQLAYLYDVTYHGLTILPVDCAGPAVYHGDNPNLFDDICLVDLPGYLDGNGFRGFGDVEQIAHIANATAIAEKQQIVNLVSQGAIYATFEGLLTDEDKAKLANYVPGSVIELSRTARDKLSELMGGSIDGPVTPDMIISSIEKTEALPADVYNIKQELRGDAQFISGSTPFMQGEMGVSGRESGTAAANVQGWSEVRMSPDTAAFQRCVQRVATVMFKFMAQYSDPDQVLRFVGDNGETWEDIIDGEVFEASFFTRVKTDAMPEGNPGLRRQNGRELLSLANELEDRGYNVDGLREQGLREMGVDVRAARVAKQPPPQADPMAAMGGMPPGAMPPGAMPPGAMPPAPPQQMDAGMDEQAVRDALQQLGGEPTPGDLGTYVG